MIQTNSATAVAAEHENDFILRPEQLRLLDAFRQTLRSHKTDADKFQACASWRDKLLAENAALRYFVAEIEAIMLEECKEYGKRKLQGWSKKMEESETDAEDWVRFVGVAREGKAQIHGCLAPLRKVSTIFGKEKVQHYGWAYEGEKYCKVLGTSVWRVPDWPEWVDKLNQLMKRRMEIWRQPLRESANPIAQIDLENLKKWTHKNSYVKMNDREKVQLPYRKLTVDDLPDEYGFDQYGLMVRSSQLQ